MKNRTKMICIIASLCFIAVGCSIEVNKDDEIDNMVENIEDESIDFISEPEIDIVADEDNGIVLPEGVDVDLTQLSSTMVYGEVFQMMSTPTLYIDKVIRMEGEYTQYTDVETGNTYHLILITDALACCEQGVEFVLEDEQYPELGSEVMVTGTFQIYQENNYTYMHLIDAQLN